MENCIERPLDDVGGTGIGILKTELTLKRHLLTLKKQSIKTYCSRQNYAQNVIITHWFTQQTLKLRIIFEGWGKRGKRVCKKAVSSTIIGRHQ